MHDIEVDQSGRTDQLTVDTVLAFSDAIQAAILIPKAVKRVCYHHLKAQGVRKHRIGVKLLTAIRLPFKRLGKTEEIVPLAIFLASEASDYITGETIVIDGGYSIW